jgi:hypothetical protein
MKQNPYACSDSSCVLLLPGAPKGMCTNGGCKCLRDCDHPDGRVRVRKGIQWLSQRLAQAEVLLDEGHTIVNDHLSNAYGEWLGRVENFDE